MASEWLGASVIDRSGAPIGTVTDVYLDDDSGEPEWLLVSAPGGGDGSFIPIEGADLDGERVRVAYAADQIADAPGAGADGVLTPEEEDAIYRHYGIGEEAGDAAAAPDTASGRRGAADDAMTRSEEELRLRKVRREAGKARLRKYVVTEEVRTKVPVTREEIRVEREPITDENVEDALRGPEISEAVHEVVLTEEDVVVEKQVVPKERVRLTKEAVVEEREVAEQVRREQIEVERADP